MLHVMYASHVMYVPWLTPGTIQGPWSNHMALYHWALLLFYPPYIYLPASILFYVSYQVASYRIPSSEHLSMSSSPSYQSIFIQSTSI